MPWTNKNIPEWNEVMNLDETCESCGKAWGTHAGPLCPRETKYLNTPSEEIEIDELEALRTQIKELEAEVRRLNTSPTIEACRQMISDKAVIEASDLHDEVTSLKEKLLAAQKALESVVADDGIHLEGGEGNIIYVVVKQALASIKGG